MSDSSAVAYFRMYSEAMAIGSIHRRTALQVSHNKRTNSHKVFKGIVAVGKSTMGWFYGFKLHLVIDLKGNIINAKLTRGNCDDRSPVEDLLQKFQDIIYGDKGYIFQDLFKRLWNKISNRH